MFSIDLPVNVTWTDGRNRTTFSGVRIVEDQSLARGEIGYVAREQRIYSDERGIVGSVPEICELRVRSIPELCRDQEVRWVDTNERVSFPAQEESAREAAPQTGADYHGVPGREAFAANWHEMNMNMADRFVTRRDRRAANLFDGLFQTHARLAEEEIEDARRAIRERQERVAARAERAHELLMIHLNEEQRKMYQDWKCFEVPSKVFPRRKYCIRREAISNVVVMERVGERDVAENWEYRKRLCAVPKIRVPLEDQLLSQKLLLETDERRFLDVAID